MSTLARSLVSASSRRLTLRMRPDLQVRRQGDGGFLSWVVKDPLSLEYYRLREEEYFILQRLDGDVTLDVLKADFDREFAPRRIELGQLYWFLGHLHNIGLLAAATPGQGEQLLDRHDKKQWRKTLSQATNPLAIRFRGFDPSALLDVLHPLFRWMFSPLAVFACVLLMLSALGMVAVQFESFMLRLPEFHTFFAGSNAKWLIVALIVTKICHEFGHGVSCRHFGGECHEIGAMLLVFTPCLYCNVTDAWMLPNKWHRVYISAAGIYVEFILASFATFVWWFTEPGFLHYMALNVMFVSSVGTLLFNANPLMRYDGYYILADLVEIPNLWDKSQTLLAQTLQSICLGLKPSSTRTLPARRRGWLLFYAVASTAYRWMVTFSIIFFLHEVFRPYGAVVIGRLLAVAGLYGLLFAPLVRLYQTLTVPGRSREMKTWRVATTLGVLSLIFFFIALIPVPHRVYTTLVVEPRDAKRVYVEVPGRLKSLAVKPGQKVEKDEMVAELDNSDLMREIEELKGRRDQEKVKLSTLTRRFSEQSAREQIAATMATVAGLEDRLKRRGDDVKKLKLYAPTDGTILPPPVSPPPAEKTPQLARWHGLPLDPENVGCAFDVGTLFCLVGDPNAMEAALIVDQADVDRVSVGQTVQVLLDELHGEILRGEITEIAQVNVAIPPRQLTAAAGGELETVRDASGAERLVRASYHVRVPLNDKRGWIRPGLQGKARIDTGRTTLGSRFWRYLSEQFRFRLS